MDPNSNLIPFRYILDVYGDSDIGLVRKKNEDAFAILKPESFFALADGLGGHRAGEVASREAISYLCQAIKELFASNLIPLTPKNLEEFLTVIYQNVNSWVHHLSCNIEDYKGMGTTLSSALFFDEHLIYSHIGDSRLYQLRGGTLSQLTSDHSQIDPNKAKTLTQIIGSAKRVKAESNFLKTLQGDIYLLCSDGLTDCVKESQMYDILSSKTTPLRAKIRKLITTAKEQGGNDNITVLMIELR